MDLLLDANVVIDLLNLGCLADVIRLPDHRFWLAENVVEREITRQDQTQEPRRQLDAGLMMVARVEEPEELTAYAELKRIIGDGEAASLAIAQHRGWSLMSYETGRFQREAVARLGSPRFLRTPHLIASAIQQGLVEKERLEVAAAAAVASAAQQHPRNAEYLRQHLDRLILEAAALH